MWQEIRAYQRAQRIATEAEAHRRLLQTALTVIVKATSAAAKRGPKCPGCRKNYVDLPSIFCPKCQEYVAGAK